MMKITLDAEEKRLKDLTEQPSKYSSAFYTDPQKEKKIIKEAFQSNNYTYLRDLPNFKNKAILEKTKQKVFDVIDQPRPLVKLFGLNNYFQPFTYTPTNYNFPHMFLIQLEQESKQKREQISKKDFLPPSQQKKMKYENQFVEDERIFEKCHDIFDVTRESEARQQIISQCKWIAGPFVPAGKKHTKFDATEVIKNLEQIIQKDWPELKFVIFQRNQGPIVVQFVTESYFKELLVYMNGLLDDERLYDYQLTKQEWAIKQDELFYFSLKPLWL
ncbi:hypothetical protein pb186bvf_000461 [Paramecium bursaria]